MELNYDKIRKNQARFKDRQLFVVYELTNYNEEAHSFESHYKVLKTTPFLDEAA